MRIYLGAHRIDQMARSMYNRTRTMNTFYVVIVVNPGVMRGTPVRNIARSGRRRAADAGLGRGAMPYPVARSLVTDEAAALVADT